MFLKKLKIDLLYYLATPLLDIYSGKKASNSKRYMHPKVYSHIIYSSQDIETTDNWIKKMWYIYNGLLLSSKKGMK